MLTLTRTAANMLSEARARQGIPAGAPLRIAAAGATPDGVDDPGITLGFVDEPQPGDQTGTVHGMPLCVAPEVATVLEDATIDVEDQDGSRHLVLFPNR